MAKRREEGGGASAGSSKNEAVDYRDEGYVPAEAAASSDRPSSSCRGGRIEQSHDGLRMGLSPWLRNEEASQGRERCCLWIGGWGSGSTGKSLDGKKRKQEAVEEALSCAALERTRDGDRRAALGNGGRRAEQSEAANGRG